MDVVGGVRIVAHSHEPDGMPGTASPLASEFAMRACKANRR